MAALVSGAGASAGVSGAGTTADGEVRGLLLAIQHNYDKYICSCIVDECNMFRIRVINNVAL